MRFRLAVRGDLDRVMRAEAAAIESGTYRAVGRVTRGIRDNVRRQMRRAFPTSRAVANLVTASRIREEGQTVEGRVFSRWLVRRGGVTYDLVAAYDEGITIRGRAGRFLAIPTENAPIGNRGRRVTPREARRRGFRLHFRRRRGPGGVLVGDDGKVYYTLVRNVRIPSRLNLAAAERRWLPRWPQILADEIDRAAQRRGVR